MALIVRVATASVDASTAMYAPQVPGLVAGAALDMAAPCYIKASDGLVYMSDATAANEAARVHGFTPRAVGIGQACTLYGMGTRFRYSGSLLTIGMPLYTGATAGRLDDGPTVGCAFPIAYAVSATDIVVIWAAGNPLTSATVGAGTITDVELAADSVTTAKILNLNVTAAKIAAGILKGDKVAESAAGEVLAAIPVLYRFTIAAAALGNTDITITNKTRITDCWLVLKGAGVANTTLQVRNVNNAVSDVMAASGADGLIVHAASLVTAQCDVADGAILRVTSQTGATQPAAEVYVLGVRVA